MNIDIQPILENDSVLLYPLLDLDFEDLYAVAADPKIWEQHPNKDRWKKEVFKTFFDGAIQSKGAFKIIDKSNGQVIGSTRFYDFNEQESSILIGYTFYSTKCWGKGINHSVKIMMMDYVFKYVSKVYFHIGADNLRSQIAINRLGVTKIAEKEVTYFGEQPKLNFVYGINHKDWLAYQRLNSQ
jgi:RimJ/RimL family protein N-acetyltransferase